MQVHEVSTSYWLEVLGGRLLEGFCMAKPLEGARKSHTPRERERERATARTSEEGSLHFFHNSLIIVLKHRSLVRETREK